MRNVENRIKLKNCEINICNFDHISRLNNQSRDCISKEFN